MIQGSSYPYLPTYFKGWMQNYVFGMRLQRHKRAK
jgi:hypothetical protein